MPSLQITVTSQILNILTSEFSFNIKKVIVFGIWNLHMYDAVGRLNTSTWKIKSIVCTWHWTTPSLTHEPFTLSGEDHCGNNRLRHFHFSNSVVLIDINMCEDLINHKMSFETKSFIYKMFFSWYFYPYLKNLRKKFVLNFINLIIVNDHHYNEFAGDRD